MAVNLLTGILSAYVKLTFACLILEMKLLQCK